MTALRTAAIVLTDSTGLVTVWNDGATELVGHRPEDNVGRDVAAIVPDEYRSQHRAGFGRAAPFTPVRSDAADPAIS